MGSEGKPITIQTIPEVWHTPMDKPIEFVAAVVEALSNTRNLIVASKEQKIAICEELVTVYATVDTKESKKIISRMTDRINNILTLNNKPETTFSS
jgi:hypothetical protein